MCMCIYTCSFPRSLVVKSLPCNAEDTGSIPDLGRFHALQGTNSLCHSHWAPTLEPASHSY